MKRWWAGLGFAGILFWVFAWNRLPLSLCPAAGAGVQVTIDGCDAPASDVERAWVKQESRIRASYPQCRLRWSFSDGSQRIEISGDEASVATEVLQWASLSFPGAVVRMPAEQKPALPCFLVLVPAKDWDAAALWTERVLSPAVLSTDGVERIEIAPAPRQVLWVTLDPLRLAAAGRTVTDVQSLIAGARSAASGPFEFERRRIRVSSGAPPDLDRLEWIDDQGRRIRLADVARLRPSFDTGLPGTFIDGVPHISMKVFTKTDANQRAVFRSIQERTPGGENLIFDARADPHRFLARLLLIVALLLGLTSVLLLLAGAHAAAVLRLDCAIVCASSLWPLLAAATQRSLSMEALCGWGLGLATAFASLVQSACSRRSADAAEFAKRVAVLAAVAGLVIALASLLLDAPAIVPWEAAQAWLVTVGGTVVLALLMRPPTDSIEAAGWSPAGRLTRTALRARHAFLRRLALATSIVLVYGVAGFFTVFKDLGRRGEALGRRGDLVYVEMSCDDGSVNDVAMRLRASGLVASFRMDRERDRWFLTSRIGTGTAESAAKKIIQSIETVPRVSRVRQVDQLPPREGEFLTRSQPILHEEPANDETLWLEAEHPDRAYLQTQCRALAPLIRPLRGVVEVDYAGAHVEPGWVMERRAHATDAQVDQALAILAVAQPRGMEAGEVLWRGHRFNCRLALNDDGESAPRLTSILDSPLPLSGKSSSGSTALAVGDVVEPQLVESPSALERRDGKAFERITVTLRPGTTPLQRDLAAQDLANLPGLGLLIRVTTRGAFLSGVQVVFVCLLAATVFATALAAALGGAGNSRILSLAAGVTVVMLGSCAAIELSGTVREWGSQATLLLVSSVLLFLAANAGAAARHPARRTGVELAVLGLLAPLSLCVSGLPLELAGLLWVPAAALMLGEIWSLLSPELLLRRLPTTRGAQADFQPGPPALVIRNVTHRYGNQSGVIALDRVSLRVEPGVFGLLGPNGAGKTTLLRILAGDLKPARGAAILGARDILRSAERGTVDIVPQNSGGYAALTVREYLEYMGRLSGFARVDEALQEAGLADQAGKVIRDLSGGYAKRVDIARALLCNPELLILDEPTSGLDPEVRIPFRRLIAGLGRDRIVLFATHLVEDVEAICSRLAILHRGRVLYDGDIADCLKRLEGKVFVGEVEVEQMERLCVEGCQFVSRSKLEGRWAVRVVGEMRPPIGSFRADPPRLEDAFVAMIGEQRISMLSWELP
ncbi:MAG: ATP-binding cassette domain-containing protein [Acidobacteriota bacterium]